MKNPGQYAKHCEGNTPEDRIRKRCVIATGDTSFAEIMRFDNDPVNAGINAIRNGLLSLRISGWRRLVYKRGHNARSDASLMKEPILPETGVTRTVRASWPLRRNSMAQ